MIVSVAKLPSSAVGPRVTVFIALELAGGRPSSKSLYKSYPVPIIYTRSV